MSGTLLELQQEIHRINVQNGWFDPEKPRVLPDDIALIHSEVSEAFEAYRDWGMEDKTEEVEEGTLAKPEGVSSELADVLVRVLDTATRTGISGEDIQVEFDTQIRSLEYSQITEAIEGISVMSFGSYIALLHREVGMIIAETPIPDRETVVGGLASIYFTLELGCRAFEIDLIRETNRKVAFNNTRGYRHGNKLV